MPELAEDIARQVKANGARLVPAEGQTGYYLGVTGQNPLRYAFLQPPDDEIPRFAGSPDGVLGAPIDSLVRNTDDHTVWINTDGDTAWTQISAGAATFPITYDDGTYTYSILIAGDSLVLKVVENATPANTTTYELGYGQDHNVSIPNDWNVDIGNDWNAGGANDSNLGAGRDFNAVAGRNVNIGATGDVIMGSLPTSDPAVSGALWNDSGTVKISA